MAIEWLAGNRLRGTTAERPSVSLQSPNVGGWVELGRTTLNGTGDDIEVASLANKRYYMVLTHTLASGNIRPDFRAGNGSTDISTNYAYRYSEIGATDTTNQGTSADSIIGSNGGSTINQNLQVSYWANLSGKEKLMQYWTVNQNATGSASIPGRREGVGKWVNTSNPINYITSNNNNAGDYAADSEVVVLGWDPDDTHTSNFWEELASVTANDGDLRMESGAFSAKKYLWVQWFTKRGGSTKIENCLEFNNSQSGYSTRRSYDGNSTDSTSINQGRIESWTTKFNDLYFYNVFIVNKSNQEKLVLGHSIERSSTPSRTEFVAKWANNAQITEIDIFDTENAGGYKSSSCLKVWGAD